MESATSKEDIALLTRCSSDEEALLLLHRVLDGACGRVPASYADYCKTWSLEEWWKLMDGCRRVMSLFYRHSWTQQQLMDHLVPVLPESYVQLVSDVLTLRQDDVKRSLSDRISDISHSTLTDFDWTTKLVVSSDRLSAVWQPVTQLDLSLCQSGDKKLVHVELDQMELKKLVMSLEAADKIVTQLV